MTGLLLSSFLLVSGALAATDAAHTGRVLPDGVAPERLSEKTLAVAIEVDRDSARVVGFTRKDRPFVRSAQLVEAKPYEDGAIPQFEVVLLGDTGAVHTDRREIGPLCLSHDATAPPHVAGDTILVHRDTFVIELPEIARADRVEVAYYLGGRAPSRKSLAIATLAPSLFQAAGARVSYADLAFAKPGAQDEPEIPLTSGTVHWPEEFGDPDIYKVYGSEAETARRINVAIVPDGYRYANKALMQSHADAMVAYFRGKTPYKEHDPFINYILVYAYSKQSGTDECDCGTIRDNAMGTRFPNDGYPCGDSGNRCLYYGFSNCDTDGSPNISAAELRAPAVDKTIVMVNTARYGGCGGVRAVYAAAASSAQEIAVHELGHSLGGLADEYGGTVACGSFASGINTSKDAVNGAWPEWIADLGPPTQGGQYYEQCIYRPTLTCDMRSLGFEFCPVCNQQWSLVTFLHARVNPTAPLASATPASPLTVPVGEPTPFSAELRLSSGAAVTNSMTWSLEAPGDPGPVVVATGVATYTPTFTVEGTHTLTFEVVADTNFVKPSKYGANRDAATWTIDVIRPAPGEVSAPGSASPQLFTGPETMVWEDAAASGSTTFNVYRGILAGLTSGDYGTCFRTGLASSSTTDTDLPAAGSCFTYLVTGKTSGGEGTMGSASSGNPRSNLHPCP